MSYPVFSFSTTADEVATAFAAEIQGKNVLITGTSLNGIGFETARVLAKHANLVVITGYNSNRLKLAEDTIRKELPSANVRPLILDLSSLAAVRESATEVLSYPEPLHASPAGLFLTRKIMTHHSDKLESQMATDHIGPFLFTKLLAPKLLAARAMTPNYTPRVVFVSSVGHSWGPGVDFRILAHPEAVGYDGFGTYCQAKSANVLSAIELSKRSNGQINAYSLHPGGVFTKMMQEGDGVKAMQDCGALDSDGQPRPEANFKTISQGAATTLVAAFDPALNDKPGAYLNDCIVANELAAAHSTDPANAERLWMETEKIIGEQFAF
ncbi:NAD-P-binding protein [Mycena crocata]|nr:NAD-P-binding protein [Mycena crocata]